MNVLFVPPFDRLAGIHILVFQPVRADNLLVMFRVLTALASFRQFSFESHWYHEREPTSNSCVGSDPNSTAGLTGGCVMNLSDFSPATRVMARGDCPPSCFSPSFARLETATECHT